MNRSIQKTWRFPKSNAVVVSRQRRFHCHFGSQSGLANDVKKTANFFCTFSHSHQPKMTSYFMRQSCRSKPAAVIFYPQTNFVRIKRQIKLDFFCTAMPDGIGDGFLTDAQQMMLQ